MGLPRERTQFWCKVLANLVTHTATSVLPVCPTARLHHLCAPREGNSNVHVDAERAVATRTKELYRPSDIRRQIVRHCTGNKSPVQRKKKKKKKKKVLCVDTNRSVKFL